jgi:hypothetical protein
MPEAVANAICHRSRRPAGKGHGKERARRNAGLGGAMRRSRRTHPGFAGSSACQDENGVILRSGSHVHAGQTGEDTSARRAGRAAMTAASSRTRSTGCGGTDPTTTISDEGQAAVFVAVDHCSAACVGIHADHHATRFQAREAASVDRYVIRISMSVHHWSVTAAHQQRRSPCRDYRASLRTHQVRTAALPPPDSGRHSHEVREHAGEVTLVGETAFQCDFGNRT